MEAESTAIGKTSLEVKFISFIFEQHINKTMVDLGWNVQIQSFTDRNNVLKRPITFNNIIATLDENVS